MKSKKTQEFIELQKSIYIDDIQFAIDDMKKAVELAEQEMIEKAKNTLCKFIDYLHEGHNLDLCCSDCKYCHYGKQFIKQLNS